MAQLHSQIHMGLEKEGGDTGTGGGVWMVFSATGEKNHQLRDAKSNLLEMTPMFRSENETEKYKSKIDVKDEIYC